MNQIRTVIADDEPLAREGIRQLIDRHHDFTVIAETRNGKETVGALRELRPELLFLDVQMPVLDGFDVVREIGPANMPAVIFVTAYGEFAVRAFEARALDYLVKPLEEMRFAETLERVRNWLHSAKAVELSRQFNAILAARKEERPAQRVFVPTSSGDALVLEADEIHWIEADDYYAAIHARGRRHLLRESLASLEQRLDGSRFVRAHRSAIVNIDCVRTLRNEAGETVLVLSDGVVVPVSRRRREQVLRVLRCSTF
jgi:two-component system LytT family response regulator